MLLTSYFSDFGYKNTIAAPANDGTKRYSYEPVGKTLTRAPMLHPVCTQGPGPSVSPDTESWELTSFSRIQQLSASLKLSFRFLQGTSYCKPAPVNLSSVFFTKMQNLFSNPAN